MKCQLWVAKAHRVSPNETSTHPVAATLRGLKLLMAGPMNNPEKFRARLLRLVIRAAVKVSPCIWRSSPTKSWPNTESIDWLVIYGEKYMNMFNFHEVSHCHLR